MYFCAELLKKKGHPYFTLWIAATQDGGRLRRYLTPRRIRGFDTAITVQEVFSVILRNYPDSIPKPLSRQQNFSLCLSAKLMFGSCVVLRKQALLLIDDIHSLFKNLNNLRWSEGTQKLVVEAHTSSTDNVDGVVPHYADLDTCDLELDLCIVDCDVPLHYPNTVSPESITLREDIPLKSFAQEHGFFGDEQLLDQGEDREAAALRDEMRKRLLQSDEVHEDIYQVVTQVDDTRRDQNHADLALQESVDVNQTTVGLSIQEPIDSNQNAAGLAIQEPIDINQTTAGLGVHEPIDLNQDAAGLTIQQSIDANQTTTGLAIQEPMDANQDAAGLVQATDSLAVEDPLPPHRAVPDEPHAEGEPDQQMQNGNGMEQLEIILTPRRRARKRRRSTFVDNEIEIAGDVMRRSINADVNIEIESRKQANFKDLMTKFVEIKWLNLNCLKQPTREGIQNAAFSKMFSSRFVTRHMPEDPNISVLEVIRTGSYHEVDPPRPQTSSQDIDGSVASRTGREQSIECSVIGRNDLLGDFVDELNIGLFETIPSCKEPGPVALLDESGTVEVQAHLDEESSHRPFKRPSTSQLEEGSPPKKSREQLLDKSNVPVPHGSSPSAELSEVAQPVLQEDPVSLVDELTLPPADLHVGPVDEPNADLFLDLPEETAVQREILASPRLLTQQGIIEGGLHEQMHIENVSLTSSSSLDLNDIMADAVQLTKEMNVETISTDDLCPPGRTRRRKAAKAFIALLALHMNGTVNLSQVRENDSVGPVLITPTDNL